MWAALSIATAALLFPFSDVRAEAPVRTIVAPEVRTIVALGDSLTAGYGLAKGEGYPPKLEAALNAKGHNVRVVNAGVSGDTSAGGRARLAWALGDKPQGVILALGANDALRGLEPQQMHDNLAAIITELQDKGIAVMLAGMRAPPNLGPEYAAEFEGVYDDLAKAFDVVFYPFLLKGVVADPALNQDDGIHPTAKGYDVLVENMLPAVETLLAKIGE